MNAEGLDPEGTGGNGHDIVPRPPDASLFAQFEQEGELAGPPLEISPEDDGQGRTMFDLPNAQDDLVPVLLPKANIRQVPSQALVRILSKEDDGHTREYLGIVVEGPFHEPDNMRADAPIIVTATVRGALLIPNYHGRVHVEIMGEVIDGAVVPPRFRPLPTSAVFVLDEEETAARLGVWQEGYIRLGLAVGHDKMKVGLPQDRKDVLPRHAAVLGTTGGGKTTTVSGMVDSFQQAGIATVLLDTEGEYTQINEPTQKPEMIAALEARGLAPHGVENTHIFHLVGRETTNEHHPSRTAFSLRFSDLSPYAVMEIMELNEAQQQRYMKAYDIAREALRKLGRFPVTPEHQAQVMELDEMETGWPMTTLALLYDVVLGCAHVVGKVDGEPAFHARWRPEDATTVMDIIRHTGDLPGNVHSWRAVQGQLGKLHRLRIFDNPSAPPLNYRLLTEPGRVSIIDLSDTDSPRVKNLVIAELLRGLMDQQEANYDLWEDGSEILRRTMVVIEEAHEFLSASRISQMPVLFQQVARIARRGRKRWLGLCFVTQLPQHLPDEVLGLVNTYVLHKISDANVVARLKKSIGGVDEGLWKRLPNLAPGQAIVSAPSLTRPLLVAMDASPCQLRMVE